MSIAQQLMPILSMRTFLCSPKCVTVGSYKTPTGHKGIKTYVNSYNNTTKYHIKVISKVEIHLFNLIISIINKRSMLVDKIYTDKNHIVPCK